MTRCPEIIFDIHHHGVLAANAVNSVFYGDTLPDGNNYLYSIGLHPWYTESEFDANVLRQAVADPRVVMIGETGLDRLRGASIVVQERLFMCHIEVANDVCKPLIVHCVKADDVLLRCVKSAKVPVVVHGYRGKPSAVSRLLDAGCCISLGERFNAETVRIIPESCLFAETDESTLPIERIISSIAEARNEEPAVLQSKIAGNIRGILGDVYNVSTDNTLV